MTEEEQQDPISYDPVLQELFALVPPAVCGIADGDPKNQYVKQIYDLMVEEQRKPKQTREIKTMAEVLEEKLSVMVNHAEPGYQHIWEEAKTTVVDAVQNIFT